MMRRVTATLGAIADLPALSGLLAGYIAFCIFVWCMGESPSAMAQLLWEGTWSTSYGIGQVLFKATPLIFTGLAVDLALRGGLFNIGTEGQLAIASLVGGVIGARMPGAVPPLAAVLTCELGAMLAGAAWAAIPALLKTAFGVHEVIATIMMNRLAEGAIAFALSTGLGVVGTTRTPAMTANCIIPKLSAYLPSFGGSAASVAVVVAFAVALLVVVAHRRTRFGVELGLVGKNPRACKAEGIATNKFLGGALVASGAVAALGSLATVHGYKGYFEQGIGAGAGYTGVAVAMLGRGSALGICGAALLFGTLQQGGLVLNAFVPRELMDVLTGVVIVAVALAEARIDGARRGRA